MFNMTCLEDQTGKPLFPSSTRDYHPDKNCELCGTQMQIAFDIVVNAPMSVMLAFERKKVAFVRADSNEDKSGLYRWKATRCQVHDSQDLCAYLHCANCGADQSIIHLPHLNNNPGLPSWYGNNDVYAFAGYVNMGTHNLGLDWLRKNIAAFPEFAIENFEAYGNDFMKPNWSEWRWKGNIYYRDRSSDKERWTTDQGGKQPNVMGTGSGGSMSTASEQGQKGGAVKPYDSHQGRNQTHGDGQSVYWECLSCGYTNPESAKWKCDVCAVEKGRRMSNAYDSHGSVCAGGDTANADLISVMSDNISLYSDNPYANNDQNN